MATTSHKGTPAPPSPTSVTLVSVFCSDHFPYSYPRHMTPSALRLPHAETFSGPSPNLGRREEAMPSELGGLRHWPLDRSTVAAVSGTRHPATAGSHVNYKYWLKGSGWGGLFLVIVFLPSLFLSLSLSCKSLLGCSPIGLKGTTFHLPNRRPCLCTRHSTNVWVIGFTQAVKGAAWLPEGQMYLPWTQLPRVRSWDLLSFLKVGSTCGNNLPLSARVECWWRC